MVRPTSRMVSAISFGVFCRSAPSTSAIIRSRKPWPGSCVTRTLIQSEMTRVPAVTAERSPPASRITGAHLAGDRRFVDRGDALDHLAVGRDEVAGLDQHDLAGQELARRDLAPGVADAEQALGEELRLGVAQRRRLRLAAPFGQRLGEIAEQDGEPEPEDELDLEADRCRRRCRRPAGRSAAAPPRRW